MELTRTRAITLVVATAVVATMMGVRQPVAAQRDPGINQPGAAGNRGVDPGLNQPGAAGNVGRDPGSTSPARRAMSAWVGTLGSISRAWLAMSATAGRRGRSVRLRTRASTSPALRGTWAETPG